METPKISAGFELLIYSDLPATPTRNYTSVSVAKAKDGSFELIYTEKVGDKYIPLNMFIPAELAPGIIAYLSSNILHELERERQKQNAG